MSFLVSMVILTAPFYYYRFAFGSFNLTAMRVFLLGCVVMLGVRGLRRRHRTRRVPATTWFENSHILLLCFIGLSLAQVLRSDYPIAPATFLLQVEGYVVMAVVVAYATTPRCLFMLTRVYVLSMVAPALIGLYQVGGVLVRGAIPPLPLTETLQPYLVSYDDSLYGGIHLAVVGSAVFPRSASTLVDANFFGAFLAAVTLVCLGFFVLRPPRRHARRPAPPAFALLALLALPLLFLTLSRSAWGGLVAGLAYLIWRGQRTGRLVRSAVWLVVITVGLGIVGGWATTATKWDIEQIFLDRIGDYSLSWQGRHELLQGAWTAFWENPVVGVGRANLIHFSGYPTAHTFYITRLAEDGLVGLAVSLLALGLLWMGSGKTLARIGDDRMQIVVAGLRAAFVSLLVSNLLYDHLISLEVNWVLLGLLAAAARLAPRLASHVEEPGVGGHDIRRSTGPTLV